MAAALLLMLLMLLLMLLMMNMLRCARCCRYCGWPAHRLHKVEDEVDVAVVLGLHEILQRDDVGMRLGRLQRHQVHDLAEGALGVGRVLEGVEDLLERHHLLGLLVDGLEDDGVGALAELLRNLILAEHVLRTTPDHTHTHREREREKRCAAAGVSEAEKCALVGGARGS